MCGLYILSKALPSLTRPTVHELISPSFYLSRAPLKLEMVTTSSLSGGCGQPPRPLLPLHYLMLAQHPRPLLLLHPP